MTIPLKKPSMLSGLLSSLKSGVKKVAPVAAAGGIGAGVGRYTGHQAGYDQGSAEGGRDSIKNLYRGLYDLMQQGKNSKTDLGKVLDIQKPGLLDNVLAKESAEKQLRVKVAAHMLRLQAVNQELKTYTVQSWRKAASDGAGRDLRVKYAALRVQQLVEKQAVLGALSKLVGLGIGGTKGAYKGLQGLGGIAASGARAAQPHLQQGLQAAGKGMADTIKANPMRGAAGMGVAGLGAGLAAPTITGALNSNVVQPTYEAGKQVYNTAQNIGSRVNNAANALMANPPQMQQPKKQENPFKFNPMMASMRGQ